MNNARLFALAVVVCLAACGTDKPAMSDTAATVPASDSSPAVAPAPVAADSMVVAPAGKASVPSKAPTPSSPAAKPAVAPPAVAAAPVAAKPAAEPAAKPAAATPTPTPIPAVAVVPSASRADPALGAPLYDANCRKCHGTLGIPSNVMKAKFPKLVPFDAAFFARRTDDSVVTVLMNGKGQDMKSYRDKLSHAEMGSVAAYIRTLAQKP